MAQIGTLTQGSRLWDARGDPSAVAPGAWLRLAALGAAGATALVVISGALHLGLPHHLLAILAAPLLTAVVVAAAAPPPRHLVR